MKNFSFIAIVFTLFVAQYSSAQYTGELHFNIDNFETDVIKHEDRSKEFHFTITDQITDAQKELIRAALESQFDVSDVTLQNDQWSMLVAGGTDKKRLFAHFIELGFKYIIIDGVEKEMLDFIAEKKN